MYILSEHKLHFENLFLLAISDKQEINTYKILHWLLKYGKVYKMTTFIHHTCNLFHSNGDQLVIFFSLSNTVQQCKGSTTVVQCFEQSLMYVNLVIKT